MVIHLFYLKPLDEYKDDAYTLYAFTDNKELAEEFKKERNMNRFTYIKEKDTIKEEFDLFSSKHGKQKLQYGTFKTGTDVYGKLIPVKVLCTYMEEEHVFMRSDDFWMEYAPYLTDVRGLQSPYLKSLEALLYIKFYGFYKNKISEYNDYFYTPYYNAYGPPEALILEDFKANYVYDELKLFLKFYGNTFKTDK